MFWILLTLGAVALTLAAERFDRRGLTAFAKPLASAGFLAYAWSCGAADSGYGLAIGAGLVLSAVGDVCLLGRGPRAFLSGLIAFFAAHVAYCFAFGQFDLVWRTVLFLGAPVAVVAWIVRHILTPYIPADMRRPVDAYMLVISLMVAMAGAAWLGGASALIPVGAVAFYLSDLSVARQRFVGPDFGNRLWGLPMYYVGQLLLAASCAAIRPAAELVG